MTWKFNLDFERGCHAALHFAPDFRPRGSLSERNAEEPPERRGSRTHTSYALPPPHLCAPIVCPHSQLGSYVAVRRSASA